MLGSDQRQSLRLVRQIPCALRAKSAAADATAPLAVEGLDSFASEFEGYCEQISDRATLNALRTLQRQLDHLQSTVTTTLVQQASWTHDQQTRSVSLSFDGLEIELLSDDRLGEQPKAVEALLNLPGLPAIVCTLQVTGINEASVVGTFQHIADTDLRRLRRYVLVQDAAKPNRNAR